MKISTKRVHWFRFRLYNKQVFMNDCQIVISQRVGEMVHQTHVYHKMLLLEYFSTSRDSLLLECYSNPSCHSVLWRGFCHSEYLCVDLNMKQMWQFHCFLLFLGQVGKSVKGDWLLYHYWTKSDHRYTWSSDFKTKLPFFLFCQYQQTLRFNQFILTHIRKGHRSIVQVAWVVYYT